MDDLRTQHQVETYKSLITISLDAFKYLALINGGAAVALLTYATGAVGKGQSVERLRWPMGFFLLGLFACGMAMFFSYLTQLKLFGELTGQTSGGRHLYRLQVAIFASGISLVSFGVGAWLGVSVF